MLWLPLILVRFPEKFHSVLKPKNGHRLSFANEAIVPGVPPPKVALGRMPSGLACGKNCGKPGSTIRRSLMSRADESKALVYWCAQLTPTVSSEYSDGLNVWSSVLT